MTSMRSLQGNRFVHVEIPKGITRVDLFLDYEIASRLNKPPRNSNAFTME